LICAATEATLQVKKGIQFTHLCVIPDAFGKPIISAKQWGLNK